MKKVYFGLHGLLLVYACSSLFSKMASEQEFLSPGYIFDYGMVFFILMIYAIFWQMILKKIPLNVAMANKAATVIWGIVFGVLFFKEKVTVWNLLGAAIIIVGIIIVVNADKETEENS